MNALYALSTTLRSECTRSVFQLVKLLGFGIRNLVHGLELNGEPDGEMVSSVQSTLHHLANAMHEPPPNIYQLLGIEKPESAKVVEHPVNGPKIGILDDHFITFQFHRIVLENQQSSLVNKVVADAAALEHFFNFLEPGTAEPSWYGMR